MKLVIVPTLLLTLAAIVLAQGSKTATRIQSSQPISIWIEKVEPQSFGYNVTVRITNTGSRSLRLPLATTHTGLALQSLNVQQWDETAKGWESAGPCRDVPPSSFMTLPGGETVWDVVPIFDLSSTTWITAVCPRNVRGLHGRIRAILYVEPAKHPSGAMREITSESLDLDQAAAGLLPTRVRVSPNALTIVSKLKPRFPASLTQPRSSSKVVLTVEIATDGTVSKVERQQGDPALAEAAVNAVRQWRFQPYVINGSAVVVETTMTLDFGLNATVAR